MKELLIGLISGTSADAIDAVLVRFTGEKPELLEKHAAPIPPAVRDEILTLTQPGAAELDRMMRLDSTVARLFAEAVHALLEEAAITPDQVRAIGSHGQTIRHAPEGPEPYTVQIGNPSLLTELTGILTVADFRRRDMAAGGQGAPLAPAFHAAFLRDPQENRVVVNIGGIANITVLSADFSQPVSGVDTGPGNALSDAWTDRHLAMPIDRDGAWAATGWVIPDLLEHLLTDRYFAMPPPKSTGREYFNLSWFQEKYSQWGSEAKPEDIQATLVTLTARSIALAIRQFTSGAERVLICGGGVHNPVLMNNLQHELDPIPVQSTQAQGVDPDYMEAMGFAWLAKRTLEGQPGNLPAVTGARGPRILGGIYPA